MRLRACPGLLMLGAGACAHLPEQVRLDVDGNSVEVHRKPPAPDEACPDGPSGHDQGR